MTEGTGSDRSLDSPAATIDDRRPPLAVGAAVVFIACLVPPVSTYARRYEFVEALQFSLLAVAVPALAVAGSPWRRLGLAAGLPPDDTQVGAPVGSLRWMDAVARGRRRHPELVRSFVFGALFLGVVTLWRIPPSVNALVGHPWLVGVEAVSLLVVGVGLWLELIESPPLSPRLSRPNRVALAAASMWAVWVLAYLVGLSHASWYHAYSHQPGRGLSLAADQQLTTGALWLAFGCAFIPVIFSNLIRWLQSEEDPDVEMHQLVRLERTRGRTWGGGQTSP
ncbi:MAG TPA: cytochrome c oxidase assembly protein [Acidimicrobiales bacterium]|jgi:cytochrome c oxidase assembly factor CtaG|nr:cytochrome c oxidase assembly protein [Acidimicrobiales bacterium]